MMIKLFDYELWSINCLVGQQFQVMGSPPKFSNYRALAERFAPVCPNIHRFRCWWAGSLAYRYHGFFLFFFSCSSPEPEVLITNYYFVDSVVFIHNFLVYNNNEQCSVTYLWPRKTALTLLTASLSFAWRRITNQWTTYNAVTIVFWFDQNSVRYWS